MFDFFKERNVTHMPFIELYVGDQRVHSLVVPPSRTSFLRVALGDDPHGHSIISQSHALLALTRVGHPTTPRLSIEAQYVKGAHPARGAIKGDLSNAILVFDARDNSLTVLADDLDGRLNAVQPCDVLDAH